MSRRVVVLLVALGITVPYCALGASLWLSRSTGKPATTGRVTYAVLARLEKQDLSRLLRDMPRPTVVQGQTLPVLRKQQRQDDHGRIALAVAGGVLVVLAAGFVFLRRRQRFANRS